MCTNTSMMRSCNKFKFKISRIHIWEFVCVCVCWRCFNGYNDWPIPIHSNSFWKSTLSSNMTFLKVFSNLVLVLPSSNVCCYFLSLRFSHSLFMFVVLFISLFRWRQQIRIHLNKSSNFYMSWYSFTLDRSQFDFSTFDTTRYNTIKFILNINIASGYTGWLLFFPIHSTAFRSILFSYVCAFFCFFFYQTEYVKCVAMMRTWNVNEK